MSRRVVITGLGAITAMGVGADALWEGLLEGRSGLSPITRFDASPFPCKFAGEVGSFSVRSVVPKWYRKAVKVMARDIELAVGAALCAASDAGVVTKASCDTQADRDDAETTYPPQRLGAHIGAGSMACEIDELAAALSTACDDDGGVDLDAWGKGRIDNLPPLWLLKYLPNMLSCHVTIIHDARGPSNTITCSEASGLLSVGESMRIIRRDEADACFSGSAESKVNPMGLIRLDLAGRLAHTRDVADDRGADVVRPFDPEAPGALLGEGAGLVLLEDMKAASRRGARVYAEAAGFGAGQSPRSDEPGVRAAGLRLAIERAIETAGIKPSDIDAIVPHASGVVSSDAEEAAALRSVFGDRLAQIPIVTITPNIGDAVAGASGVSTCVAAMCMRHQALPARLHAGACPDDLQAGACDQRDARLNHMLVCTNSLGGQSAALVLRSV